MKKETNPIFLAEAKAKDEIKKGKFTKATFSVAANTQMERDYIKQAKRSAGSREDY